MWAQESPSLCATETLRRPGSTTQGQTRDHAWPKRETRQQARAPDERQPESCEHTREQQRWKDTKIQGQGEPQSPQPLTRRFCAWLAFSSSFLLFLVTSDLSFVAQLRDLFKGVSPILGGLITALPV